MDHIIERVRRRELRGEGREPNFDPDLMHEVSHGDHGRYGTLGWKVIYPAGINPEFDGIEYNDDSVPPEFA